MSLPVLVPQLEKQPREEPTVLGYASLKAAYDPGPAAAIANVAGQLIVLCVSICVGEGFFGLPAHEDGWQIDLLIGLIIGVPATFYGLVIFALFPKRRRNVAVALIAGSITGLVLAALMTGSEVVSGRLNDITGYVGLGILLTSPIVGASLSDARW